VSKVFIRESVIKNNHAYQGPVFAIYGQMPVTTVNCSFNNNTAVLGRENYFAPKRLSLKVYEYREELLYTDLTLENIINEKSTVIYKTFKY